MGREGGRSTKLRKRSIVCEEGQGAGGREGGRSTKVTEREEVKPCWRGGTGRRVPQEHVFQRSASNISQQCTTLGKNKHACRCILVSICLRPLCVFACNCVTACKHGVQSCWMLVSLAAQQVLSLFVPLLLFASRINAILLYRHAAHPWGQRLLGVATFASPMYLALCQAWADWKYLPVLFLPSE